MANSIYFDNQATTQLDPSVADAMQPYLGPEYGNPHSTENSYGRNAANAIELARCQVAESINAEACDIFFTSGATEANNWLLHSVRHWSYKRKIHIIATALEHPSFIEPALRLPKDQVDITWLEPASDGLITVQSIEENIRDETLLVSTMGVNNEIGVIQPLEEIGKLCHERGLLFHTDAAQALGKVPLDALQMNLDFISLSGHKCHGPMGIGALHITTDLQRQIEPLMLGGGQQQGLRSGTLPVALCVGFGLACEKAVRNLAENQRHLIDCRERLLNRLESVQARYKLNGSTSHRIPGNLNIQLGIGSAQHFLSLNQGIALSTGSACSSDMSKVSSVLRAIGLNSDQINKSFRVSMSGATTYEDIDVLANALTTYLSVQLP